jgi:hypothetical protein
MGGCFGGGLRVMHQAVLVRADGQLAAKLLAIDDDGDLRGFARLGWLGVRVVGHGVDLSDVSALNGSRSLFLGVAPAVLDLDEAGTRCNLPVKECLNLVVVAG